MNDDIFADLVGIKPSSGPVAAQNGSSLGEDDVVLPSPASGHQQLAQQALGLSNYQGARTSSKIPPESVASQARPDVKSQENGNDRAIQSLLERFARGVQQALEDTNRRLDSLENQTEQIAKGVADLQEVSGTRAEAVKGRLSGIEKVLREIQRGVQLVRDKQELAEAQADLANLPKPSQEPKQEEVKPAQPPQAAKPVTPTPSMFSQPAAEEPAKLQIAQSTPAVPQQQQQQPPANQAPPFPQAPPAPHQYQAAEPPKQQQPPQQQRHDQRPSAPASLPHPSFTTGPPGGYGGSAGGFQGPPPPPFQPDAPHYPASPYARDQDGRSQNQPQSYPPPQQRQQYPPPPPPGSHFTSMHSQPSGGLLGPSDAPALPYSGAGFSQPQYSNLPPPPPTSQQGYPTLSPPSIQSGFPRGNAPPPPSMHQHSGSSSYPPPPMRHNPPPPPTSNRHGPPSGASNSGPGPQSRNVPLEQVIDDVANMGFSRHEVREAVVELTNRGQSVDLNIILDRLMHGRR